MRRPGQSGDLRTISKGGHGRNSARLLPHGPRSYADDKRLYPTIVTRLLHIDIRWFASACQQRSLSGRGTHGEGRAISQFELLGALAATTSGREGRGQDPTRLLEALQCARLWRDTMAMM